MNILYDFSSALLQARQRKGVTQEQIAFALDISQATYNAWECGHRICPYKHIVALIGYFDDEQFTRRMLRILLSLQHNMAGLNRKSTAARIWKRYAKWESIHTLLRSIPPTPTQQTLETTSKTKKNCAKYVLLDAS